MVIVLFQIQVMMPHVSALRQHDQQHTVFILSLPVVIAAVPAGSLPSACSMASSLSMPHILSAKMQTKYAGPDWKRQGEHTSFKPKLLLFSVLLQRITLDESLTEVVDVKSVKIWVVIWGKSHISSSSKRHLVTATRARVPFHHCPLTL